MRDRRVRMVTAALAAAGCLLLEVSCGGSPVRGAEPAKAVVKAPAPTQELPYDHAITDTSRLLAGMAPEDAAPYGGLLTRTAWTAHRGEFDASWKKASTDRWPEGVNFRIAPQLAARPPMPT